MITILLPLLFRVAVSDQASERHPYSYTYNVLDVPSNNNYEVTWGYYSRNHKVSFKILLDFSWRPQRPVTRSMSAAAIGWSCRTGGLRLSPTRSTRTRATRPLWPTRARPATPTPRPRLRPRHTSLRSEGEPPRLSMTLSTRDSHPRRITDPSQLNGSMMTYSPRCMESHDWDLRGNFHRSRWVLS